MTDYNTYLDGLMAACRESVQSPFYRPHSPLVPPQPGPFRISLNQRRPGVSTDRPAIQATGTADTSRKVQHAATACRPDVPENLPAAINAPRPSVPKTIQPPIATPHANGDRTVPPAPAYAPHPAIPRKPFPEATAPSPFAPISQVSIENSTPAHGPQKVNEPVTPTSHLEPEKSKCADHMKDESDKIPPLSYRNMPQRVLRPELKRRGLLSGGPNPELVKRLEQDDAFQATQRTAENYDTMDPKDVHRLCAARLIPSNGTTSLLRDRLKAHDKRGKKKEPAVPIPISIMSHSGHLPVLETKASRKMLDEKPLVPTTKDERALRTKTAERIDKACEGCQKRKRRCIHDIYGKEDPAKASRSIFDEKPLISTAKDERALRTEIVDRAGGTLATAKPKSLTGSTRMHHMTQGQVHKACEDCQTRKRRCVHDIYGEEDPAMAAIPSRTAFSRYSKDKDGVWCREPTLDNEVVAPKNITKLRLSNPRGTAFQDDEKPSLAVEERAGTRATRSSMSRSKAAASRDKSRRPADHGRVTQGVKKKTKASIVRRKPMLFQPKDEISLLQICVKLKEVIAWGKISGFWYMVQDTLQLKTGKEYKKVSRHVEILVAKRRAEQQEIEQWGKMSTSRVSAGCRPLLDKWIAGGKQEHPSPKTSKKPVLSEDEEDTSLGEETIEQPDSDDSALGVQKRSATDAWLDTSYDTTRSKKVKLSTSELTPVSSTSHNHSVGCWSLSGSSVTSESSLEDEDEDEDEDDVKSGKY